MKIVGVKISGMHKIEEQKLYLFASADNKPVYFYGPNGSGKSTVLQAIQLGLLGYIPGTNKTSSAIFSHANGKCMRIEVRLVGDTDDEPEEIIIIRKFTKTGAKVTEEVTIYPETYDVNSIVGNLELPILNFNEFLGLTANKQKDLMISVLPSSDSQIDSQLYLNSLSEYDASMNNWVKELCEGFEFLNNVADIKNFNSHLKEVQSELNAEEKRTTSTVQSLIFYDDYEGTLDVDSIQGQIQDLMSKRDKALRQEEAIKLQQQRLEARSQYLEEYGSLAETVEDDSDYQELNRQLNSLDDQLERVHSQITKNQDDSAELKSELAQIQKVLNSEGICPFIEYNCERIEGIIPDLKDKEVEVTEKLNVLTKGTSSCKEKIAELEKQKLGVRNEVDRLVSKYRAKNSLKNVLDEPDEIVEDAVVTSSELSEKLQMLNDALIKASANQKYNELMEVVQKQKLELVDRIAFIKAAVKATGENGLQSKVMVEPFKQISSTMQSILTDVDSAELGVVKFNLEEKANSFSFGFERDGKFIPFELLSSGEKCIFTLIFMIAVIRISNSLVSFILIDDLFDHLDDLKFSTIIKHISAISNDVQIIFAGVKPIENIEDIFLVDVVGWWK